MNELKENIGKNKPTKSAGTSVQGILKTQLEVVEVENVSLCPHILIQNYALTVECTRQK